MFEAEIDLICHVLGSNCFGQKPKKILKKILRMILGVGLAPPGATWHPLGQLGTLTSCLY
jgi:hypothetical protein